MTFFMSVVEVSNNLASIVIVPEFAMLPAVISEFMSSVIVLSELFVIVPPWNTSYSSVVPTVNRAFVSEIVPSFVTDVALNVASVTVMVLFVSFETAPASNVVSVSAVATTVLVSSTSRIYSLSLKSLLSMNAVPSMMSELATE